MFPSAVVKNGKVLFGLLFFNSSLSGAPHTVSTKSTFAPVRCDTNNTLCVDGLNLNPYNFYVKIILHLLLP
jgi:hypothetical protein